MRDLLILCSFLGKEFIEGSSPIKKVSRTSRVRAGEEGKKQVG